VPIIEIGWDEFFTVFSVAEGNCSELSLQKVSIISLW